MKINRLIAALIFAVTPLRVSAPQGTNPSRPPEPVSLIRLVAAGAAYDGVLVSTVGYLHLEYEGNILYVSENDYKNAILQNGIQIDPSQAIEKDQDKLNGQYVMVKGIFQLQRQAKWTGVPSGVLTAIRTASPWSNPAHPVRGRSGN